MSNTHRDREQRAAIMREVERRGGLIDVGGEQMIDLAVLRSVMRDWADRISDAIAEARPLPDPQADRMFHAELDRIVPRTEGADRDDVADRAPNAVGTPSSVW
jgi:hypothetical protein